MPVEAKLAPKQVVEREMPDAPGDEHADLGAGGAATVALPVVLCELPLKNRRGPPSMHPATNIANRG